LCFSRELPNYAPQFKKTNITSQKERIFCYEFADFLLVTKDVLTCPENEIHTAKPAATYFEGKKVYGKPNE